VRLLAVGLTLFVLGIRAVVGEGTDAHSAGTSSQSASAPSRAASVKQVCGPPSTSVVRTAPASAGTAQAAGPRTVALTFDDGPGEWTPGVLAILREKSVHATFFVVGEQVSSHPDALRAVASGGHLIGDHTWSHHTPSVSAGWDPARLTREIERTRRAILKVTGQQPCVFRPPGGVEKGAGAVSRKAGMSMVLWSVDTRDWSGHGAGDPDFASRIRERAREGLTQEHPVILMHDGGGNRAATVAALGGTIDDFRARGYQFVRLDGRP
jgi:peptidoglycan/xylan/chitin deacetylase (PgdA/CDA1 family)